jgi:biopolymer transport protein ExbD
MKRKLPPPIFQGISRIRGRLEMPVEFNPAFVLIPIGFCLLLLVFTRLESDFRLLSSSVPVTIDKPEAPPPAIWFSLAPSDDKIRIVSRNGDVFFIDPNDVSAESPFPVYLKKEMNRVLTDTVLSARLEKSSGFVVLSVDQHLTYQHVRPVLYALANAGVARYGFETRSSAP